MAVIRPCADLRNNYNEISRICHQTKQPVFITKNGYSDLVILSNEAYEKFEQQHIEKIVSEYFDKYYSNFEEFKKDTYQRILQGIKDIKNGNYQSMDEAMKEMEAKYGFTRQ